MATDLHTWTTRKAKAEAKKAYDYFGLLISADGQIIWESGRFYMNRRKAAQAAVDEARRRSLNLDKPIGDAGTRELPKHKFPWNPWPGVKE